MEKIDFIKALWLVITPMNPVSLDNKPPLAIKSGEDLDILLSVPKSELNSLTSLLYQFLDSCGVNVVFQYKNSYGIFFSVIGTSKKGDYWGLRVDLFMGNLMCYGENYLLKSEINENLVKSQEYFFLNEEFFRKYKSLKIQRFHHKHSTIIGRGYSRLKKIGFFIKERVRFGRKKSGKLIVFLGPDGSGKSSLIDDLKVLTHDVYNKNFRRYHFKPGVEYRKHIGMVSNVEPHADKSMSFFHSLVRFSRVLLSYLFYSLGSYHSVREKSQLHIFDRYYYDYYVDSFRLGVVLPHLVYRVGEFIIPKPDYVFVLIGEAETIANRKNELSLWETKRQIALFKEFSLSRGWHVLDSSTHSTSTLSELVIKTIIG